MATAKEELEATKVVNQNKLTTEQEKEFEKVLSSATKDKFLGDDDDEVIREGKRRLVILYGEKQEIAGFYSPETMSVKGTRHWRAGALYLIPKFRGKGIME